jgi:hypothetical protein
MSNNNSFASNFHANLFEMMTELKYCFNFEYDYNNKKILMRLFPTKRKEQWI